MRELSSAYDGDHQMAGRFVFAARSAHSHERQSDNGYAKDRQSALRALQHNNSQNGEVKEKETKVMKL